MIKHVSLCIYDVFTKSPTLIHLLYIYIRTEWDEIYILLYIIRTRRMKTALCRGCSACTYNSTPYPYVVTTRHARSDL